MKIFLLQREDMFRFFDTVEIQGQNKNINENIVSDRKEVSEN